MRLRRRTAVLLGGAAILVSLGIGALVLLRAERIRGLVLGAVQGLLNEGYEAQIDSVEFSLAQGMARVHGFRLLRAGVVLASAPRVEVETRLWKLSEGKITQIRLVDPQVLHARAADGEFEIVGAFRRSEGPAEDSPRVVVQGGSVLFRDGAEEGAILAPGAEARLRIAAVARREARRGRASSLEAVLVEEGPADGSGAGALGRIVVRGEIPPGKQGLRILVERFAVGEPLLGRLAPGVRAHLEPFGQLEGTMGEGPDAPGLEVHLSAPAPDAPVEAALRVRPRGLQVLLRDFPVRFTDLRGEAAFAGGELTVDHIALRRVDRGEIHIRGKGRLVEGEPVGNLQFWARDVAFDEELHDAMPAEAREVWDAYHLGGIVDFTDAPRGTEGSYDGWIARKSRDAPVEVVAVAHLVDGSLSFRGYEDEPGVRHGFDFPVSGATGRLAFRMPVLDEAYEITLANLRGSHGPGPARSHGTIVQWPDGRARVDVTVEADEVPLDDEVREASQVMGERFETWSPRGIAKNITVHVTQDPVLDPIALTAVTLRFDGRGGFTYRGLPLPVDSVGGIIEVREERVDGVLVPVTTVRGMTGVCDGAKVSAEGTVEGEGDARLRINADVKGLRADGAIREAAEKAKIEALTSFFEDADPRGLVDLRAEISGTESRRRDCFRVDLRGIALKGGFGVLWPIEGLEGSVDITPEQITLRGLRGRGPEGAVTLAGTLTDPGGTGMLDLVVAAEAAPLDATLLDRVPAAKDRIEEYLRVVGPRPGLAGEATVRLRGPAKSPDPEILVEGLRGGVEPLGLKGLVLGGGTVRFGAGVVSVEGIEAAFEDRSFRMRQGRLDLDRGSGTLELEVRRLRFPRDLVPIVPEEFAAEVERLAPDRWFHADALLVTLADGFRTLRLDGAVALSPPREGSTGGLGLEGVFDLRGVTFARGPNADDPTALSGTVGVSRGRIVAGLTVEELEGTVDLSGVFGVGGNTITALLSDARARVEGRPLVRAGAEISFPERGVLVKDLRGTLAGGALEASVQLKDSRPKLQVSATLSNANARAFFEPADATSRMEGKVTGFFRFRSPTGEMADAVGDGSLVVTDGKLFTVPIFETIYGFAGIAEPPQFAVVRLGFEIKGTRLRFNEILLDSSVLALHRGPGESNAWLDGRVAINLSPELKGVFRLPGLDILVEALKVPLKPVWEAVLTYHVGGTIQNPVVNNEPFANVIRRGGPDDKPRFVLPPPAVPIEPAAPTWF